MSRAGPRHRTMVGKRRGVLERLVLNMILDVQGGDTPAAAFRRFAEQAEPHITPDLIEQHRARLRRRAGDAA